MAATAVGFLRNAVFARAVSCGPKSAASHGTSTKVHFGHTCLTSLTKPSCINSKVTYSSLEKSMILPVHPAFSMSHAAEVAPYAIMASAKLL